MAYPHGKHEYILFATAAVPVHLSSSQVTNIARWAPGYVPFIVRAVSVQQTATTAAEAAAVFSFRDDPLYGSSTATANQFTTITTTTGASNLVYYRDDFTPREISVGDKVTCIPTTGSTGDSWIVRIYGDHRWETPANATGSMATG